MTFENLLACGFDIQIALCKISYGNYEINIITPYLTYVYYYGTLMYFNEYMVSEIKNEIIVYALLNLKKPIHVNAFLKILNEYLEKVKHSDFCWIKPKYEYLNYIKYLAEGQMKWYVHA